MRPWRKLSVVVVAAAAATLLLAHVTHATAPYTVTTDASSYSVQAGGSQDVQVTLSTSDSNPLDDPVDLCVLSSDGSALPDGLSANSVSLQNDGDSDTITISVDSGTTAGDYTLVAASCDGSIKSDAFTLTVTAAPDYSINTFDELTGETGHSVTPDVNIAPAHGFNNTVSICLFGGDDGSAAPSGITLKSSPVSFDSDHYDQQPEIDIASDVAPDTYSLYFGDCGATHFSNQLQLTVAQPTFHYGFFDDGLTKHAGESFANSLQTAFDADFSGPVTFTAAGDNPAGITVGSIPGAATSGAISEFNVSIASNVPTGDYLVGVVGHGSGVPDDEEQFSLHVDQPAGDGDGALSLDETNAGVGTGGNTLHFHYATSDAGGTFDGALQIDIPSGWSAPSPDSADEGYVTSSVGAVSVSGQTITISNLNLAGDDNLDVTYGDTSDGGPGATAPSGGDQTIHSREKSTSGGTYTDLADLTSLKVTAPAGSGTLTVSPATVAIGACGLQETLTYTAAAGGIDDGELVISVPDGWTGASTDATENGYTTLSGGGPDASLGVDDSSPIVVTGITLAADATLTIVYGDTAGGQNDGACAPDEGGTYDWTAYESSADAQDIQPLDSSPSVVVASPDGTGDLSVQPGHAGLGSEGNTLYFALTNVAMGGGEVDMIVPAGWSAPSTGGEDPGYVTASCQPDCSVALGGTGNRTIKITGVDLDQSSELDITYGDRGEGGPGALAPSTGTTSVFTTTEKSTSTGTLTALTIGDGDSNTVTLVSPDGSGTMTVAPPVVPAGQSGITETFTYTAASGGLDRGVLQLVVPDDWDAPQTDDSDSSGFVSTNCDACEINLDGQTIEVDDVTLAKDATLTITYANGDSPPEGGDETWYAYEASSPDGYPADLAASPDVSAVAADGTGDIVVSPAAAVAGVSHNALDFNYTAADGGLTGGTITIKVPTGWSAPSVKKTDPGFTSCNSDGCSVTVDAKNMLITVAGISLNGGDAMDIVYGDQSQGSSGAKSGAAGSAIFVTKEKSWTGGVLTALSTDGTTITVLGPPKITGISPTSGLWEDPVEIDGSNFQSVTDVKFNGQSVDAFDTSEDGTAINTTVPDGSHGGKITLVYPGGTVVSTQVFTVIAPPEVDSFSPNGGIAPNGSAAGTKVVIKGLGFTGADAASGGEVDFGGTAATTWTVNSDTQITATVPVDATTGPIQVINAADTGSSDQDFIVLQQPSIDGFDPGQGGPGMQIEIDGSGFDYGGSDPKLRPVVKFGGKVSTNVEVDNDNVILANIPTGATTGKITVTNLAGSATSDDSFTVINPPKLASFKPVLGVADDGSGNGTTVTLTGSNFTGATDVLFSGADDWIDVPLDLSQITKNGTTITVQVPESAVSGQIAVVNDGGTSYSKGNFAVVVPPAIDSFYPDSGKVNGVTTIYGSGFTGTTAVLFTSDGTGGTDTVVGKFTFKNDGQLNATIPNHAITGPITIVNAAAPDGIASDDDFAVIIPPTVTGFVTDNQPAIVGDAVEIDGTNFTYATKVAFGGVVQTDIEIGDDGTITTTVPPGAKTGKISVTTPAGTGTGTQSFQVTPPPTITKILPLQAGVGATITISGTNFVNVNEIDIGDATDGLDNIVNQSATKLVLTVPDDASSGSVVVYTDDRGYAVGPKQFGLLQQPEIDSLSTDDMQGVIGQVVTIYGSGFTGTSKVTFGGVVAKYTVADDGTINTSVPKGAHTGPVEVTVPGFDPADSDTFSVITAPKFTSFTPASGRSCDTLVIHGSGLTGVSQITWDEDTLTLDDPDYTIVSDTEIDLPIPEDVSSGKKLTLTNIAGSVTTTAYTITSDHCG